MEEEAGRAPEAAAADPLACFNRIYHQHYPALHAYFLARTGDGEEALDLLQEVFLRVWRHVHVLQEMAPDRQRYWIFGIARNLVTDHYRRHAARSETDERLVRDADRRPASHQPPEVQLEEQERMELLDHAIRRLPEGLRTILLLRILGGLSSVQIGGALGMPAGTVRYQLSLARRHLATELGWIERGACTPPKASPHDPHGP